jgi:TusE/DsrC/DsvC family sulfur relay protein
MELQFPGFNGFINRSKKMADILGAPVDEEGFLVNLTDWTKDIAVEMAKGDDIDLSDEHWEVIDFLREYYEEYQIAPAVRVLTKAIGKKMGKDKGNSKYLYSLFPYGPGKQGCRFAGLPKPTGCI